MAKKLSVEIWSDIACPWCYVGKRRLEAALAQFPHAEHVVISWKAFELDPSAPAMRDPVQPYAERLAKKYGTSAVQAQGMIDRMVGMAAADGLRFDFERIRPGNTFNAHRLLHLAAQRGKQDALKERLLRGYMSEGAAIGDSDTLLRLAVEAGLDPSEAQTVLSTDAYASEVRADEAEARALGVDGVPFFLLGRRYAVAGAQPSALMLQALTKAWDELPAAPERLAGDGVVCGPDGCADPGELGEASSRNA
jgi:predicted DsbA family dithiol-disulfide isomerase